ncbi:putative HVA22 protein g [Trifolium repens]|nr:putative HVA22 protein g [Trifolium repens]
MEPCTTRSTNSGRSVFGYAYPTYECHKGVEKNKPEIEQLRFWCQNWTLVVVLTVCERLVDIFISWFLMYSEAKLAFFQCIVVLSVMSLLFASLLYDAATVFGPGMRDGSLSDWTFEKQKNTLLETPNLKAFENYKHQHGLCFPLIRLPLMQSTLHLIYQGCDFWLINEGEEKKFLEIIENSLCKENESKTKGHAPHW